MGHRYAILGSGRQGTAAAYDLAVNGDADSVVLADLNAAAAKNSARRVNTLSGGNAAKAAKVDVTERASVLSSLKGVDVLVSAVPEPFNPSVARWAVAAQTGH